MIIWLRLRKNGKPAIGLRMDEPSNAVKLKCKCGSTDWIEKMGGFVCSKCRYFVHRNHFK